MTPMSGCAEGELNRPAQTSTGVKEKGYTEATGFFDWYGVSLICSYVTLILFAFIVRLTYYSVHFANSTSWRRNQAARRLDWHTVLWLTLKNQTLLAVFVAAGWICGHGTRETDQSFCWDCFDVKTSSVGLVSEKCPQKALWDSWKISE